MSPSISNAPTDTCLDVPDWSDSYGDGCNWYDDWYRGLKRLKKGTKTHDHDDDDDDVPYYYDDACDYFANYTGTYGLGVNDACCICGGGTGEEGFTVPSATPSISSSPSKSSPPSTAPSVSAAPSISSAPSISPTEFCLDVPDWTDSSGDGCNWYDDWYRGLKHLKKGTRHDDDNYNYDDDYYYDDACEHWANHTGTYGLGVNDACCICGGGTGEEGFSMPSGTPSISSAPSVSPSLSAAPSVQCFNIPDWTDMFGDSCDFYTSKHSCQQFATAIGVDNMGPLEACCGCGGGVTEAPSPSPSSLPSISFLPTSGSPNSVKVEVNLELPVDSTEEEIDKAKDLLEEAIRNQPRFQGKDVEVKITVIVNDRRNLKMNSLKNIGRSVTFLVEIISKANVESLTTPENLNDLTVAFEQEAANAGIEIRATMQVFVVPESPNPCRGVTCGGHGVCRVISSTEITCVCENTFEAVIGKKSRPTCICPKNTVLMANVNRCISITDTPSKSPSFPPTMKPTVSPTGEIDERCMDSTLKMKIEINGEKRVKQCEWVARKEDVTITAKRCTIPSVASHCPVSCKDYMSDCIVDSEARFKVSVNQDDTTKTVLRYCAWAARKPDERCFYDGVGVTCRKSCANLA
ncbi:predicted protein [Chaetoceros tenuissimus]|uniref:Uncharacterized protein n=1 Tax=Chaetoceros tenuissimus TaxID=426638 RepID=A0AAD3CEK6_9STRA|nr:predicted protein [Chaetoceros tenuissimus]